MTITTIYGWDMGHRIPFHKSKCKNLHGHRYTLEVTLGGDVIRKPGSSSEAMIMDFGDVKNIVRKEICDRCDHSFMYWEKDRDVSGFFKSHRAYKHIAVPFIPTAEKIAHWVFMILQNKFKDTYGTGLALHSVTVWETPTSKASFRREDEIHEK